MVKVWGRRNSFNVQKVLWLVGELGLDYEHIPAGGTFGRLDEPAFRALNPHGKIPVLEDGDVAVWESHTILRYLAARFGQEGFWSQDAAVRAQADGWMDWAQSTLQPAFLNGIFLGYFRTREAERNWPAIKQSLEQCGALFGLLDRILADRPYLMGEDLTLADIPAGTTLYRYFELDIDRPALPNVEAWYRRLQQRPAYREHVMVSFEDMRAQP